MLGKNTATNSCLSWLQESIGSLRSSLGRVPGLEADQTSLLTRRMLQLAVTGDLEALLRSISLMPQLKSKDTDGPTLEAHLGAVVAQIEVQWQQDRLNYDQVLQGFWTIRRALEFRIARGQTQEILTPTVRADRGPVLFASIPGGEHVLGALSVADYFVLHHWQVDTCLGATRQALLERISSKPFQLIGLTIGTDAELDGLADLIIDIRTRLTRPVVPIILGGNVFVLPEREYRWLGANFIAGSAEQAIHFALQSAHYNYASNESRQ
jgi:hypothetical protein